MNHETGLLLRILVVSNDFATRRAVVDYLNENCLHDEHCLLTAAASGFHEVTQNLAENEPNLVILDLARNPEDGLDMLREIRSRSNLPVIVADSRGCGEIDRVVALALGADDYLIKPLCLHE